MSRAISISPTADYLRQARRLRARWSGRPWRMQRELQELNRGKAQKMLPVIDPGPAQRFCEAVAASLDGPVLRYSARLRLLRQARRLKIERFEANLLIASVQHRMASQWDSVPDESPRRPIPALVVLVAVELVLILVARLILR